uniref:Uncharacterized protein n=1 Tax=Anguilla anguilla TaxID=7936 RepID=A0A0E9UC83_ANGAN
MFYGNVFAVISLLRFTVGKNKL